MTVRRLVAAGCALLLLAGCGADPGREPAAGDRGTPAQSSEQADGPSTSSAEHSGPWDLVLTDVRLSRRRGGERIVLELDGTGVPGWSVAYTDVAVLDGSGETLDLRGDVVLDIYASGTVAPGAEGYRGGRRVVPAGAGRVTDLHVVGTFEGHTQVLAGIAGGRVPFRVRALGDPTRLVVDLGVDTTSP
ncbi:hypothetical protein NOK12_27530 [Nocardioides sp. OK12]|uniref:AMIN-like domain-containing (lipo)protein n=1 Tax=Nocardioides sp. OK12 TaxID=2758661 RepID=UPI0021C266D0|nr:hypothetical protein [Nocardioides sp. OK12]GHJ60235.1 hypothetical protein NOK12_27530 [Nocardioides sp. OK12]